MHGAPLARPSSARCTAVAMPNASSPSLRQDDLQQPLQVFIEGCLPTGSGASVESEIREEWPTLLKELTEIMPEIVTYLLPQLQVGPAPPPPPARTRITH